MTLIVVWGRTATHAPPRPHRLQEVPETSHISKSSPYYRERVFFTMCGKPPFGGQGSGARTYKVEGPTPSCRRCRQLMAHWNRKPEA